RGTPRDAQRRGPHDCPGRGHVHGARHAACCRRARCGRRDRAARKNPFPCAGPPCRRDRRAGRVGRGLKDERVNTYLEPILAADVPGDTGAVTCESLTLPSRYQPIFCAAEQRPYGYEGLLVAYTAEGKPVAPHRVFDRAETSGHAVYLDWLSRALHLRNWRQL